MSDKYLIDKSSLTALADITRAYNQTENEYTLAEITEQVKTASETYFNLFENGITELRSDTATSIRRDAFCGASVTSFPYMSVTLPNVTKIGMRALSYNDISEFIAPKLTTTDQSVFVNSYFYNDVSLPELTGLSTYAFQCAQFDGAVYLPKLQVIGAHALEMGFCGVYIILKSVPILTSVPEGWDNLFFLVPPGKLAEFQASTNWAEVPNIEEATDFDTDIWAWEGLINNGYITEEEARAYYDS